MSELREEVGEQQSGPAGIRVQHESAEPNGDVTTYAHGKAEQKNGDQNQYDKGEQIHAAFKPQEPHEKSAPSPLGAIKLEQQVDQPKRDGDREQITEHAAAKARQSRLLGHGEAVEFQDHENTQRDLHRLAHEVNLSVDAMTPGNGRGNDCNDRLQCV